MEALNKTPYLLFNKTVLMHSLCWLVLISYELTVLYYSYGVLESPKVYILYYIMNILYFYGIAGALTFVFDHPTPRYLSGVMLVIALVCGAIV